MHEELNAYVEHQVATASPVKLIDLLYARAVRDLAGAKELLADTGNPRSVADGIHLVVHAQQIIQELNGSLNVNKGGEIAHNLHRLYEYFQYRLTESVTKREAAAVEEIHGLLSELHEGWHSLLLDTEGAGPDAGEMKLRAGAGILVA